MRSDPTFPQIVITIDPDTGEYEAIFDELKNGMIINVLTTILLDAKSGTLPRKEDV